MSSPPPSQTEQQQQEQPLTQTEKNDVPKLKAIRSRSPSPSTKKTVIESRRAEQNRAAQRAFRQRKERYVKELEARVNAMADWPARMEALEVENEHLKRKIQVLEEENSMYNNHRKSLKLDYINNREPAYTSSSSSPPPPTQLSPAHTPNSTYTPIAPHPQQQQQQTTSTTSSSQPQGTGKFVVGEKGRVLDDLVSILRTRHRPPIQPN